MIVTRNWQLRAAARRIQFRLLENLGSDACGVAGHVPPAQSEPLGMILGEGAAMLVLEPFEVALARGAHIYAEIVGFGMSSDASHITQSSMEGPARAMRSALQDAALPPECVGYINAHGTDTVSKNSIEARAILSVFGNHSSRLAVSSTKSMHGHALGAAGALEAAATVLALSTCIVPPTANFTEPDPSCALDVCSESCPSTNRRMRVIQFVRIRGTQRRPALPQI